MVAHFVLVRFRFFSLGDMYEGDSFRKWVDDDKSSIHISLYCLSSASGSATHL